MLKLTRTGIGLLTRQYRSVLHKCWLINVGLWQAMGDAVSKAVSVPARLVASLLSGGALNGEAFNVLDEILLSRLFERKLTSLTAIGLVVAAATMPSKAEAGVLDILNTGNETWTQTGSSEQPVSFNETTKTATGTIGINTGNAITYYTYTYTMPSNYASSARISSLTSNVTNKYFYDKSATTRSGAIYTPTTTKRSITADFIKNHAEQSGGAIGNGEYGSDRSVLGTVSGNFIGNYVNNSGQYAEGGAVWNFGNYDSTIDTINGDFIDNGIKGKAAKLATGGAIYNKQGGIIGTINGNFVQNYIYISSNSTTAGGAIFSAVDYNGRYAQISSISGNFIGNYSKNTGSGGSEGGAISNGYSDDDSIGNSIGTISGNFISNYVQSTNDIAYGGAIFNTGTITNIGTATNKVTFSGNYAQSTDGEALGGAIYNKGTITSIGSATNRATFAGNYATSTSGTSHGGAIHNDGAIDNIYADFTGNTAQYGGAINNENTIGNIIGDFLNNTAKQGGAINNTVDTDGDSRKITSIQGTFRGSDGSAIFNDAWINNTSAEIDSISGSFSDNYNTHRDGGTDGAGIMNWSDGTGNAEIGTISADFTNNSAGRGAAIFNSSSGSSYSEITSISGSFSENSAEKFGGAIYNAFHGPDGYISTTATSIIGSISGQFDNNSAYNYGGAIYNLGTITNIGTATNKVTFSGNYATSTSSQAQGGAIYNSGTISNVTGDFIGNYVKATSEPAEGGAMYNTGTIELVQGNFINNKAQGVGFIRGGAIQNGVTDTANTAQMTIIGNFIGNSAVSTGNRVEGGAIENVSGAQLIVTGDFISNYVENYSVANSSLGGGAITNSAHAATATVTVYDASFINNYVKNNGSSLQEGGAIMNYSGISNKGIVNLIAQNKDIYFYNNKAGTAYNDYSANVTSNSTGESYLNLNAVTGKSITFNGTIINPNLSTSNIKYAYLNINQGSSNTGGEYVFNNSVLDHYVNLYNGAKVKFGAVIQGKELGYTNDELAIMTDAQRQQAIDNLHAQANDIDTIHAIQKGTASLGTGESLSYGSFDLTSLQNDANGGYIDMRNSHIDSNSATTLTLGSQLKIGIDLQHPTSGTTGTADKITYTTGSGSILIDAINEIGTRPTATGTYLYQVLNGSGVTLALTDAIKTEWNTDTTTSSPKVRDPIAATTAWTDKIYNRWTDTRVQGSLDVSGNNLVYSVINTQTAQSEVAGDTLALVTTATNNASRIFSTTDATAEYLLSTNLGAVNAVYKNLSINGTVSGNNRSTLNLGNYNGFVLDSSDDNLSLSSMKVSGGTDYSVNLANSGSNLNVSTDYGCGKCGIYRR